MEGSSRHLSFVKCIGRQPRPIEGWPTYLLAALHTHVPTHSPSCLTYPPTCLPAAAPAHLTGFLQPLLACLTGFLQPLLACLTGFLQPLLTCLTGFLQPLLTCLTGFLQLSKSLLDPLGNEDSVAENFNVFTLICETNAASVRWFGMLEELPFTPTASTTRSGKLFG